MNETHIAEKNEVTADLIANILRNASDAKRYILFGTGNDADTSLLDCVEAIEVESAQLKAIIGA